MLIPHMNKPQEIAGHLLLNDVCTKCGVHWTYIRDTSHHAVGSTHVACGGRRLEVSDWNQIVAKREGRI